MFRRASGIVQHISQYANRKWKLTWLGFLSNMHSYYTIKCIGRKNNKAVEIRNISVGNTKIWPIWYTDLKFKLNIKFVIILVVQHGLIKTYWLQFRILFATNLGIQVDTNRSWSAKKRRFYIFWSKQGGQLVVV